MNREMIMSLIYIYKPYVKMSYRATYSMDVSNFSVCITKNSKKGSYLKKRPTSLSDYIIYDPHTNYWCGDTFCYKAITTLALSEPLFRDYCVLNGNPSLQ